MLGKLFVQQLFQTMVLIQGDPNRKMMYLEKVFKFQPLIFCEIAAQTVYVLGTL